MTLKQALKRIDDLEWALGKSLGLLDNLRFILRKDLIDEITYIKEDVALTEQFKERLK